MGQIKMHFFINAPLEQVWRFGLDQGRMPEWQPNIVRVKKSGLFKSLSKPSYTLVYKLGFFEVESPIDIVDLLPYELVRTRGRTPIGGEFTACTKMKAVETGTIVDYHMDYQLPGGFLGRSLDRLIFNKGFENYVRRTNAAYKALAEKLTTRDS